VWNPADNAGETACATNTKTLACKSVGQAFSLPERFSAVLKSADRPITQAKPPAPPMQKH